MGASASGNSYIGVFKACHRKFYFRHVRGLVGKRRSKNLDVGTLCHTALEVLPHVGLEKALIKMDIQWTDEMVEGYDDDDPLFLARLLINGYDECYRVDPFTSVVDEFEFSFAIGPYTYTGKIDRIVQGQDGAYYVMDHKTSGLAPSTHMRMYFNDPQLTGYYIGAAEALKSIGVTSGLSGVIVDGLYKPRKNKGGYGTPQYVREIFMRDADQVTAFLENTEQIFNEIASCNAGQNLTTGLTPNRGWTKNEGNCWSFMQPCSFMDLCRYGMDEKLIEIQFDVEIPDVPNSKEG